jgi:hypothetical protein
LDESVEDLGEASDDSASDGHVSDLVDSENEEMDTEMEVPPPSDEEIRSDIEDVEGSFDVAEPTSPMVDDHVLMEESEVAEMSPDSSNEAEESLTLETQNVEDNGVEGETFDHDEMNDQKNDEGSDDQYSEDIEVVVEVGI